MAEAVLIQGECHSVIYHWKAEVFSMLIGKCDIVYIKKINSNLTVSIHIMAIHNFSTKMIFMAKKLCDMSITVEPRSNESQGI